MAGERDIRSTRNPQANYREATNKRAKTTSLINNSTTTSSTTSSSASTKTKFPATKSSPATLTSRLSTSSQVATAPTTQKATFEEKIRNLESRLSALETSFNQLSTENATLRETVVNLQSELSQLRDQNERPRPSNNPTENRSALDQQEINSNIVIRGIDVNDSTPAADLTAIYEGIRSHLGVSDIAELDPVSISLVSPNTAKPDSSLRPIRVVLSSVESKIKFLQVRRIKKDIVQSDIGLANNSKRPILITEQLTRSNQELLFQARSLREGGNFKFVWSKNGEVFARYRPNTRVIRIIDKTHVNNLRTELNLEPLSDYGRLYPRTTHQSSANDS